MLVLAVTDARVCCPVFMAYDISACNVLFPWFTMSCNQKCSVMLRMHEIRFFAAVPPGPRWGSSRRFPRPPSRLGRKIPPFHTTPPPRRLRRLVLGAYDESSWVWENLLQGLRRDRRPCSSFFRVDNYELAYAILNDISFAFYINLILMRLERDQTRHLPDKSITDTGN